MLQQDPRPGYIRVADEGRVGKGASEANSAREYKQYLCDVELHWRHVVGLEENEPKEEHMGCERGGGGSETG